jgi:carbamoyl-phosphate synthase large subunit
MLSSAGRRVALLRLIEQNLQELGLPHYVLTTDLTYASSAMQSAACCAQVPPFGSSGYLHSLMNLVKRFKIRLIIPTIDPELDFYAKHQQAFTAAGCTVHISAPQTISIAHDKHSTYDFLLAHRFPTVRQWPFAEAVRQLATEDFPLIVKPRYGSASSGVTFVRNTRQLLAREDETDLIVQTVAEGQEYTVDVYVGRDGKCRCAVPRLRLATRAGEVSKAITVRNSRISRLVQQVAEALPGAYGVLNIQIFHNFQNDEIRVIEINPRFGGGYPLSHAAGAPMVRWILEDVLNLPSTARDDLWQDHLVMLRYDEAVFVGAAQAGFECYPTREKC